MKNLILKINIFEQRILDEADYDYYHEPEVVHAPVSYTALRSKTSEARDKLGRHRIMLDRYLPVPSGVPVPVEAEVDYKFGELVSRYKR